MSQSLLTGNAMANEAMGWNPFDDFMNPDPGLYSSDVGFDMQGVGTGETGGDGGEVSSSLLSDGLLSLPQGPSQQQLDQQASHHADYLSPCLHGGAPDRAIAAPSAAYGFHPLSHVVEAGEIGKSNIGYLREPDATHSELDIPSPSMLSGLDGTRSGLPGSASNAGIGALSKAIHERPCACISCAEIGWYTDSVELAYQKSGGSGGSGPTFFQCRYPGCQEDYFKHITDHERSHFRVEGQYFCVEEPCLFTTKRWSDLKRHTSSKHCTRPAKEFSCPVLWCKYSGSNGFARKDKLKSHFNAVHGGMTMPGKTNQFIKPKANGGA